MSQLTEQLTGVRLCADALRAQTHEFMNKLHVVPGLWQAARSVEARGGRLLGENREAGGPAFTASIRLFDGEDA